MDEGKRKSPRRSPRILIDVGTSNQKFYRSSRMRGQVSSPTDEVNDGPNFSLGISQLSGEQNKDEQNKEEQNKKQNKGKKRVKEVNNVKKSKKRCVDLASTSKKIADCDDDFEDLPPQFQSKNLKNKDGPEKKKPVKDAKTRNRLPKNVILPESRYPKTIAESPWQKYIEKCLFMPTKNKFENTVASEDEVSKFRFPEPRDYNVEILKLEPKGSSHGLDMLTNEVIELRKKLVKVNENNKALEEKIDLGFNQIKEFVVNSNKQLLEDISLLFAKSGGSSSVIQEVREPSKKQAGRRHDAHVMRSNQNEESQVLKTLVRFADVEIFERVSSKIEEDVAGIAIEKVLSEVVADINVQEVPDVNTVGAQPYDTTEDCQKHLHTLDDFIFLDEDLSQINRTEESYLKKRAPVDQNKKKVTPKKRGRKKNPGKGKKPYTDALNVISPAFELGICNVAERHLFFKLAHSGQEWCDEHIDVIFYYLRKKGKYEASSNVRFTTTDCVFKTKITTSFFQLCDAYENKKNYKVKDSDDIARYIYGRRLLASTSWDKVDYILFPLNIKEGCHWILVVFDIRQRSLEVYDSFLARDGVNFEVKNIVEMFSIVLPYYLSVVKFYDKRPELRAKPKYSRIDEFEKIEFHFITKGVPRQQDDSLDWEFSLLHLRNILRKRFGAILWEYARGKQASDLQSEDERPDR
ncbi:hypothetical protein KY290_006614 [Solanum tuberosum]|uniref:Ubiquitin-like protease family profile domain-containing protein n=1 Tax=Solanum tuberosum TaxID=4113 RepID=A0ABQ7WHI0_SOLTU|nr:hypothetical protein KY290_006614 [Solanum tuberosum]